jgi:hypothetical protein
MNVIIFSSTQGTYSPLHAPLQSQFPITEIYSYSDLKPDDYYA